MPSQLVQLRSWCLRPGIHRRFPIDNCKNIVRSSLGFSNCRENGGRSSKFEGSDEQREKDADNLSTASKSPLNQVRAVIESNSIRAEQQSVDCTLGEPKKYAFLDANLLGVKHPFVVTFTFPFGTIERMHRPDGRQHLLCNGTSSRIDLLRHRRAFCDKLGHEGTHNHNDGHDRQHNERETPGLNESEDVAENDTRQVLNELGHLGAQYGGHNLHVGADTRGQLPRFVIIKEGSLLAQYGSKKGTSHLSCLPLARNGKQAN
mmetsp:Transcript_47709/g.80059  ORF Transcript_47709/g.80059 Transcript_47709/m.80059 type:complete len:261 (-) Transcript_47709:675-1457(-)